MTRLLLPGRCSSACGILFTINNIPFDQLEPSSNDVLEEEGLAFGNKAWAIPIPRAHFADELFRIVTLLHLYTPYLSENSHFEMTSPAPSISYVYASSDYRKPGVMKMSIEGLTGGFGARVASCYFHLETLRAIWCVIVASPAPSASRF